jgi:hypothetical protein
MSGLRLPSGTCGYNRAIDEYGDILEEGILDLDPTKATRLPLQNAPAVAGLLLRVGAGHGLGLENRGGGFLPRAQT